MSGASGRQRADVSALSEFECEFPCVCTRHRLHPLGFCVRNIGAGAGLMRQARRDGVGARHRTRRPALQYGHPKPRQIRKRGIVVVGRSRSVERIPRRHEDDHPLPRPREQDAVGIP